MATTIIGKGNRVAPTATATQSRVVLYQPTQRPQMRAGEWMETSYGKCRVHGRLGQRHADAIEAILYCAEKRRDLPDGGVEVLVDPARARRVMSGRDYSYQQLWKLLREVMAAVVEIEAREVKALGHLVDHVVESNRTKLDPLTGGERPLWRVRLGAAMVMLMKGDLGLWYDPAPIARLQHGISQAVARHVMSHKRGYQPIGGWRVDKLIRTVSGKMESQALRDARRRLRDDTANLDALGITLDHDRIRRQ